MEASMNKDEYAAYRLTPRWQELRGLALERDGYRCRVCNSPERLDVHHRTYDRVGHEEVGDLTTLCDECHSRYHDENDQSAEFVLGIEALREAYDYIDRQQSDANSLVGTGFIDLDEKIGSLYPREFLVIAARPSVGKTAFILNIARNLLFDSGKSVLICTMEQSRIELAQRLLCLEAKVSLAKLRIGHVLREEMERIIDAGTKLKDSHFLFYDKPGQTVESISFNAKKAKSEHGVSIIFIDYLQLVESRRRSTNREQEVAKISRRLRGLANESGLTVVACSQLNRSSEDRMDHRPRLADLRESGSIEQDADIVLLMHRPEMYEPGEWEGVCEVNVAKNRNGPIGEIRLSFAREYLRFENCEVPVGFEV
jgi:replicative DNA helicase